MRTLLSFLVLFATASLLSAADSPLEDKKRPVATTQALTPAATAAALHVPAGFRVELIAGEPKLVQPIAYAIDDRGRLWVVENTNYPSSPGQPKDRILVLEDTKGRGTFDKETVFWDKATFTSGIAIGFGGVWLGSPPNLLFLPMQDGDAPKPAGEPQILLDGWEATDTHETLNDFIWGPDGWLYGTQGIFNRSLVGKPGTPPEERIAVDSAVWRFHPQHRIFERWSEGGSNQWGVDWNDHGESFFEACVIPHMWHAIQGARYQRQAGPHPDVHTYDDIKTIAWGRYEKAAYCGAMVYLGGAFPPEWRDQFFFHDIHMNKMRCETMTPSGSGFRSERKLDFVVSSDPWFRGLSPQYGPDGGVFVNDWYDRVPCHQQREFTDRSNGRIYKIVPDGLKPVSVNLAKCSEAELIHHHLNANDWYVRHARRLLQERGAKASSTAALEKILFDNPDDTRQLRALWTLHAQRALSEASLLRALSAASPAVRGWAVTCACENGTPSAPVFARLGQLASKDPSPVVRRRIASALQRLPINDRWTWLESLASRAEDVQDQNIPLLLWYAFEPAVGDDPARALALARHSPFPRLAEFTARRLAAAALETPANTSKTLAPLSAVLAESSSPLRLLLLGGLRTGIAGHSKLPSPEGWDAAYAGLSKDGDATVRKLSREIAILFGNTAALGELRELLSKDTSHVTDRSEALEILSRFQDPQTLETLLRLIQEESPLRRPALRALSEYSDPRIPTLLSAQIARLPEPARSEALNTLAARVEGVQTLLAAIDAGTLEKKLISAPLARKIQGYKNKPFDAWLEKNWGKMNTSSNQRQEEILRYKKFLGSDAITSADLTRGRELFRTMCSVCHQLFGTGGDIGPHLTGGYNDLDYLLQNILDPNAVIGKEYQTTFLTTTDGALQAGIVSAEDASSVTLKTPGAPLPVTIPKDKLKSREVSPNSLMPEGLLNHVEEPDVRSLFLYLRQNSEPAAPLKSR